MGIAAGDLFGRPPPKQTRGIPDCQGKTPAAQMHFASELPLSPGNHSISINGHMMTHREMADEPEKNGESPVDFCIDRDFLVSLS